MLLTETAAQSSVLRGTSAPIPASTVDRAPTVWRPTGVTLTLTGFLYMVDTNRAFVIGTNGTFPVQAGLAEPQVGPIATSSHLSAFGAQSPYRVHSQVRASRRIQMRLTIAIVICKY